MKKISVFLVLCFSLGLFAACSKEEEKTYDYTAGDVYDAIKEAYGEDFLPDGDMNEEEYTVTYGLDMDKVEDIKAGITMISFHPDRLLVAKAKQGEGESVEETLKAARDNMVETGMWYPANLAKVNASQVVRAGDYVAFIMLGAVDEREDATEEEAAEFAKEQVQIGVDAFNALFED